MSITTAVPREDEYAEPWRQWQFGNAKSNLGLQLLSSPAWP